MPLWKLEGYDTEMREARCREYTTSEARKEAWEQIPRIQFSDSGHGIVFTSDMVARRSLPTIARMDHARDHLLAIGAAKRSKRTPPASIAIDRFVAEVQRLSPHTCAADLHPAVIAAAKATALEPR